MAVEVERHKTSNDERTEQRARAHWEQRANPGDPVWENSDLVDIDEFISHMDHLGKPVKLSPIQREALIAFLGQDPKKIFSNGSRYLIAVLLWGKGSGKDWLCAIIMCYCLYVLLNMKSPQTFFGLDPHEPINLVNVTGAGSQESAVEIFFNKLKENILNWRWLTTKYSIYEEGRLSKTALGNTAGRPRLDITSGRIRVRDKHLNILAYGSDNEKMEGGNVLVWLMDEASAFNDKNKMNNAKKIYSTLRTSATTRFKMRWKGLVISYPRADDDFTVKLYEESQKLKEEAEVKRETILTSIQDVGEENPINIFGDTIYGSRHPTWEVLPKDHFCGQTFTFDEMTIPIEYKDDFDKYPEESKAKLACIPPAVEDAFIRFQDRIFQCVVPGRTPLFTTHDTPIEHRIEVDGKEEIKHYVGKLVDWMRDKSLPTLKQKRVIHVDGGLVKDSAALVLAHGEPHEIKMYNPEGKMETAYVNKVVVDAIIVWTPDQEKRLQVSLSNVESLILELRKWLNIVKVSYDQWNSQTSLETLQSHGIYSEMHTITNEDYYQLRTMINNGAVELLPPIFVADGVEKENVEAKLMLKELTKLKLFNGKKVDHPVDGSKETSDSLAGVNRLLNDEEEKRSTVTGMPKAITGLGMTRATPNPFSPAAMGINQELPSMPGAPRSKTPQTGVQPGLENAWVQEHNRGPQQDRKFPGKFPRGVLSGGQSSGGSGMSPTSTPNQLPRHLRG
jgi:hypothetical protein